MEYTLNTNKGILDIEFDICRCQYEYDYYPVNITHEGRPIELTQSEWDRLYDHVQTLQLMPDNLDWGY